MVCHMWPVGDNQGQEVILTYPAICGEWLLDTGLWFPMQVGMAEVKAHDFGL